MTHRQPVLRIALTAVAGLGLVTAGCGEDYDPFEQGETSHEYVSRPDLGAPGIEVTTYGPGASQSADDDLIFLAPKDGEPMNSLLIVDSEGEPVWIHPLGEARSYDLKVQEYDGEPVLTWWRGENLALGYGAGEWVVMDSSYEEIATITTQEVQEADFHDLTLTDEGTALMVSYPKVRRDLSEIGGPAEGYVIDNVVQEVDVETGEVLFEWSALDHIPLTDTRVDIQTAEGQDGLEDTPFDYAHINSVSEDDDGSLLISARNTHAIYRVDRESGEIDWTLGGTSSDFAMSGGAAFAWQHDAERQPDGTITLYDNENLPPMDDQSRGLRLELDEQRGMARVVTEYLPPDGRLAESQGNLQVRDNGNVFIGWGQQPYFSEYTADGRLLLDAALESGESYRSFRLPWVGEPADPPTVVVEEGVAHVSWNGATEVASWRFLAGEDAGSAREVATVSRAGFETVSEVPDVPYVAVEALDANGQVLAVAEA
jgi:Arylsulfotransferase (ASST)